jgi:uncharacterized phage-associated protein
MTASANQVAAALRRELPELPTDKAHKLLYYTQGHHLALFGRPAFTEAVFAADNGPAVDFDDDPALKHTPGTLPQSMLNVVLLVATRYGHLTAGDLSRLSRAETPWQATQPGQPIEHQLLDGFFNGPGAQDPADPRYSDPTYLARLREEASKSRDRGPVQPDDLDVLLAKVSGRDQ